MKRPLSAEEVAQAFHRLSNELVAGQVDPKVVILYSLSHAISVTRGMGYSPEEFQALLSLAIDTAAEAELALLTNEEIEA